MSELDLVEPGDRIIPDDPPKVMRYRGAVRLNHWITATAMVLLIVSGLSMYHPIFFFLTNLFGGGQFTRFIHPWIGLILVASFVLQAHHFWRGNLWNRRDLQWLAHIGDLLAGRDEKMPEVGKYNAGQKFVFWSMLLLILVMLTTGVVIWEQFFGHETSIPTQREAVLIHSVAAVFIVCVLIIHVYAAIWVRGSFDAMIRGWVSAGWAWRHHRLWFRRLAARSADRGDARV